MNDTKEFALIPLDDYNRMKKSNNGIVTTLCNTDDIIFLGGVFALLDIEESDISIVRGYATVHLLLANGYEVRKTFRLDECSKYYNKPSKFMHEILGIE